RPLSSVDRSLAVKATTPSIADTGAPATDAPTEDPGATPRPRSTETRPVTSDVPAPSFADTHRAEPSREPEPTNTATSGAPARHEMPQTYGHRLRADRPNIVRQQGGSPDTEAAVKSALAWLAANQEPDGHWDAA